MAEAFDKLYTYITQFPFVRYALIVGVLIALCSSLLGVTLVLRRFSFIGDGLSHVAFGAMAIAAVLKLTNSMPLILCITVISAILLLRTGKNAKIKGDAAVAVISVSALAIGYLLMNIFSSSSNLSGDVCTTLFGSTSILTLTTSEVWLCIALSAVVLAVFVMFYNKVFCVTFDEDFAKATGVKASAYNHKKSKKVCEDYSDSFSDKDMRIIVVADGHGSNNYPRAQWGSRFAVSSALKMIKDFINDVDPSVVNTSDSSHISTRTQTDLFRQLEASILKHWHSRVNAHFNKNPLSEKELESVFANGETRI